MGRQPLLWGALVERAGRQLCLMQTALCRQRPKRLTPRSECSPFALPAHAAEERRAPRARLRRVALPPAPQSDREMIDLTSCHAEALVQCVI